jgi:tetratricopeptide (TPR) repeat protein
MLASQDFSAVDRLRVRAAIHTGTADERDGDYFGPTVNKVARLLAIGHGGQVLMTADSAALVDRALAAGVALRDLGAYHLKDFVEPQRVYQLVAPGLSAEFPPLRSLGTLPSDLSIIDTTQFRSVASFGGRDQELGAVHAALANEAAIVIVHGLGGVGKSSIAREYGWRNRDDYSVVWWLNAQTEDGMIEGLLRLGAMFLHGLDQLADRRAAAQRVANSVLGGFHKPVLLVFDNLEDEALMRAWLPRTARALATSRDTAWSADVTAIALRIWSLETAIQYLRRASSRTDLDEDNARAIAETLGALPLALAHAAAALRNLQMVSPRRYLERVSEQLKYSPRGAEYPRSVFATFSTAIAQAEYQAAGAAAVLCFAASFAPEAIPDELFRQSIALYPEALRPILSGSAALGLRYVVGDELRLDEALGTLDRLSLLTFTRRERTYSMHRLVQLAARDLVGDIALEWREGLVAVTEAAFPEVEFTTWPQCERLIAHASAALGTTPRDSDSLLGASLATRCSRYLWERADIERAEELSRRALAIREQMLGPNHLDVAMSLHGLALVVFDRGRYDEAASINVRVLRIREQALGPNHPDVALSLNSLGLVYFRQARYEETEQMQTRALAIREETLGPNHPDVAAILDNIANVYRARAQHKEAEALRVRALTIREAALAPDHPDIVRSLNNLAATLVDQGHDEEAHRLLVRALAITEQSLGQDHRAVAPILNNLAEVLHHQRRYSEAEELYRRSLSIREKALGPNHPDVALGLDKLAQVHSDHSHYEEAEALLKRALLIREKSLGLDHPLAKATLEALDAVRSKK